MNNLLAHTNDGIRTPQYIDCVSSQAAVQTAKNMGAAVRGKWGS